MSVKKIKDYLIESYPGANGNAYSSSKRLYESIKVTDEKTIEAYYPILEGIDWEVDEKEKGGVIVLSTDVNAVSQSKNKFIDWIKKRVKTLKNRIQKNKIVDKVSVDNNLIGWTVGNFLSGRYKAKNGKTYGENSLSVEIVGVSSETLLKVATELCDAFDQESVLVKDYTTGNIYFANKDSE